MRGCSFWLKPKDGMLLAMVEEGGDLEVIEIRRVTKRGRFVPDGKVSLGDNARSKILICAHYWVVNGINK